MSDSATPWTVDRQAPLSIGFPRQEHWSVLPFPPPGDLLDPEVESESPALAGGLSTAEPPAKSMYAHQLSSVHSLSHVQLFVAP